MGGNFLISSAVLKGKNKSKCDDNVYYIKNEFGIFVGLSDGAGSSINSHLGSLLSLGLSELFLISLFKEKKCNPLALNKKFKKILLENIKDTLIEMVKMNNQDNNINIKNYAATLLFAQYIEKYDRWIIGHLGDGVIGGIDNNENLIVISTPENGEFSNETFFFSDENAYKHLRFYWVKGIKGIVMFSDGPEAALYDKKNKALAPALKNLFRWQSELKENFNEILQENLKIIASYTHDDCSILIIQKEKTNNDGYRFFKR